MLSHDVRLAPDAAIALYRKEREKRAGRVATLPADVHAAYRATLGRPLSALRVDSRADMERERVNERRRLTIPPRTCRACGEPLGPRANSRMFYHTACRTTRASRTPHSHTTQR